MSIFKNKAATSMQKVMLLYFLTGLVPVFAAFLTPPVQPKNLHVYNTAGNAYVDTVAYECSGARYLLSPSHAKYDAVFSLLLAAQMGGRKVQIKFSSCNTTPQGIIEGVYIVD